ncbi:MAG: serine/threonine protein kinase, partial [Planctomycetota bacterium]
MSSKVSASTRTDVRTDPEPYIREFLRLIDEGWEPDLEEYLNRIPDTLRDQVFQRLDEELEQRNEASWDELAAEVEVEEEATAAEPEGQPPLLEERIEAAPEPENAIALSEEVEHALELDVQPPLIQEEIDVAPEPSAIQQLFAEAEQAELVSDEQPAPMQEEFEIAPEPQPSWPSLEGYRLERELGSGSLGESYLAWDEANRRQIVLKFPGDSLPEKVIDRTMRDAEKAAMLEEPGVVTFETRVGNVLVAPYIEGEPIHRVDAGIELLLAFARRLASAHAENVFHLDLKPNNVLVTPDGACVLLDYGVGAAVLSVPPASAWIGGLPHFESPEHANRMRLGAPSDVFSFGSLLYRVLTGQLAFPGGAPERIRERIEAAEPTPLRVHDESIPQALQDICLSCFARKTNERPSMSEIADDLERFLEGRSVRLRPRYYRVVLRKRVREVVTEVKSWRAQGLATEVEAEQLETVCQRLLAREEQWTHDASNSPRLTRILPIGALLFAVAAGVLVRFGYAFVHPAAWIVPLVGAIGLLGAGLFAALKEERTLSVPLLAGGLAACLPALVGRFQGIDLLTAKSLALPGLSWLQLAVASGVVFLGSVGLLAWRRDATYAWFSCGSFTLAFIATLGVFGLA